LTKISLTENTNPTIENISEIQNIELLTNKKTFLEKELITTYDSEKKFALQQQIKELELRNVTYLKLIMKKLKNQQNINQSTENENLTSFFTEIKTILAQSRQKACQAINSERVFRMLIFAISGSFISHFRTKRFATHCVAN